MSGDLPRILLVEDDAPIRAFLRPTLRAAGYALEECASGSLAVNMAAAQRPDLLLLDLGLPDMDGYQVIERLRTWTSLPIVILSARTQEQEKVQALDAGADDYLTKPFGTEELLARIRATLRRTSPSDGTDVQEIKIGNVVLDLTARIVLCNGEEIHLTRIEYRLLVELARHAGRVMTHRQLLKTIWGPAHVEQYHYLRVHMASLRRKLEAEPARPRHLITEQGVGYRLVVD